MTFDNSDYFASSTNSVNENQANEAKTRSSAKYQLRQLIKPLLAVIKRRQAKKNSYLKQEQPHYFAEEEQYDNEQNDNLANELLEARIFSDIDRCGGDFAAVPIYSSSTGAMDFLPVQRGQRFVPVHFAKTEAGTFFWTSTSSTAASDCDSASEDFTCCSSNVNNTDVPLFTSNMCDRWAQA